MTFTRNLSIFILLCAALAYFSKPTKGIHSLSLPEESSQALRQAIEPDREMYWILYADEGDVYVQSEDGEEIRLTDGRGTNDFSPIWGPKGDEIYFGRVDYQAPAPKVDNHDEGRHVFETDIYRYNISDGQSEFYFGQPNQNEFSVHVETPYRFVGDKLVYYEMSLQVIGITVGENGEFVPMSQPISEPYLLVDPTAKKASLLNCVGSEGEIHDLDAAYLNFSDDGQWVVARSQFLFQKSADQDNDQFEEGVTRCHVADGKDATIVAKNRDEADAPAALRYHYFDFEGSLALNQDGTLFSLSPEVHALLDQFLDEGHMEIHKKYLSPNRQWLAYFKDGHDLYILNTKTLEERFLSKDAAQISGWSRDGKRLLVESDDMAFLIIDPEENRSSRVGITSFSHLESDLERITISPHPLPVSFFKRN